MSNMFLTKKERIIIAIEAIVYVCLIAFTTYITIFGKLIITMFPLFYILGIIGRSIFKKRYLTGILSFISIITIGFAIKLSIDWSLVLLAIYSAIMVFFGSACGHIISELHQNYRLKKFIKYYTKIIYYVLLIILLIVPIFLNAIVRGNIFSYMCAKKNMEKYINEKYDVWSCGITDVKYIPNYNGGKYMFEIHINNETVFLSYYNKNVYDETLNTRLNSYNQDLNKKIIKLYQQNLLDNTLKITAEYSYTKIDVMPNELSISIKGTLDDVDKILDAILTIKGDETLGKLTRLNIIIDGKSMSISGNELENDITKQFILDGMNQEILDDGEAL